MTHPPAACGLAAPRVAPTTPRRHAFVLIELLMAMFILALGLSAVAAIFPVATYLQKQTFNDLISQQLERNVEATFRAISLDDSWLSSIDDSGRRIGAPPSLLLTATDRLPLAVRCYPTALDLNNNGIPNESSPDEDSNFDNREFYWVPLFQDTNTGTNAGDRTWVAYIFILAKQRNSTYPTSGTQVNANDPTEVPKVVQANVSNATNNTIEISGVSLQAGDKLLLDNGLTPTVTDVEGNTITLDTQVINDIGAPKKAWYAPPANGGTSSPTVAIKIISIGSGS